MPLRRSNTETAKLQETVEALPKRVADWTPQQRQQFETQSDRAMREQADVGPNSGQ